VATDAKICLVSPEPTSWGGIGHSTRQLAKALSARHEVTIVHSGIGEDALPAPIGGVREEIADKEALSSIAFSCENHHRSAAALAAIERAYGSEGPDYLEVADFCGHGLVPLQARRTGHPLLSGTLVGVKLSGELCRDVLRGGVNDIGGTLMEETISRMAGAEWGIEMTPERFDDAIRAIGRIPTVRTTTYERVAIDAK